MNQQIYSEIGEYKTDNNLCFKTEMNAGHGGKSGRDSAIEEVALDYSFALKIAKKIYIHHLKFLPDYYINIVSRLMGLIKLTLLIKEEIMTSRIYLYLTH